MFEHITIVVAAQPESVQTIRNILGPGPKIIEVYKLYEAKKLINENVDLIICGLHFNDSRMFDLLRSTKANPLLQSIPFLCFKNSSSELGETAIEAFKIASTALGAVGFVDYHALKLLHGAMEADKKFRKIIEEIKVKPIQPLDL